MEEKMKDEAPKVLLTQGEDGKLKTVDPTKENADSFLKIDTRGNPLENFFKKFPVQFNNPSLLGVFSP